MTDPTDRDRETARMLFPCVCDLPDPCPCMEAREKCAAALAAAREEEREACARIAEASIGSFGGNPDYAAQKIVFAIRARGTK